LLFLLSLNGAAPIRSDDDISYDRRESAPTDEANTLFGGYPPHRQRKLPVHTGGRPDTDGHQRYSCPDPTGSLAVDKVTGEILPAITTKSLTMPLRNGPKHGRHFPHGSADWKASYGMRSIIEGFNGYARTPLTKTSKTLRADALAETRSPT